MNANSSCVQALRNAPPGRKGRFIPDRLLSRKCPQCGWKFEEGERYFRAEDGREIHVQCRPAEVVLQYGDDVDTIRTPCPECDWPYRLGERVIVSADGIDKHAECPEGRERTVPAPGRKRCEGCGWWIEEGEEHLETLVISRGGYSDNHVVKHSHLDCPDDASELVANEKAEQEERERRKAEQEEVERKERQRRQRHASVDRMIELREAVANGELRLERVSVEVPDGNWAKVVTEVEPEEVNRGGYAFIGSFIDTGNTQMTAAGDLVLVAHRSRRTRYADLYRVDPTVLEHDQSHDCLQHLHSSSGSAWAIDMLEAVERELDQGPPLHLVAATPEEDVKDVDDEEHEDTQEVESGQSDEQRIAAAVELLRNAGYTVKPPMKIYIPEDQSERHEQPQGD